MELSPGTPVDRYTVEDRIGEGGMAAVYRVRHKQLGSVHALKMLTVSNAGVKQRLVQEGRVQATLRHVNIVAVTDIVDVDGSPGLIMEFVEGPNLGELLERHRPTPEEAEALATGIIEGVACAHKLGLIHRDLKPGNVLIAVTSAGPVPKVADFGLAKLLDGDGGGVMSRTRSGTAMGTPSYMAPEQIRDAKNVDKRADVFALGALIYELYCGAQAFPGEDILTVMTAIATGNYPDPREYAPDLPDRVLRAIRGALAVRPADRIPDCEALLATLRGAEVQADGSLGGIPMSRPLGSWSPAMMASIAPRNQATIGEPTSHPPAAPRTYALSALDVDLPTAERTDEAARTRLAIERQRSDPARNTSGTLAPSQESVPSAPRPASVETAAGPSAPSERPAPGRPAWLPGVIVGVVGVAIVAVLAALARTDDSPKPPVAAVAAGGPAQPGAMTTPASTGASGPTPAAGGPVVEGPAAQATPGTLANGAAPASPSTTTASAPGGSATATPASPTAPATPAGAKSPGATASTPAVSTGPSTAASATARGSTATPTAAAGPASTPPAASTAPAPTSTAAPSTAAPSAAPPAPAAAPTTATVSVSGDARRVWLEGAGGRFPAGEVPPGTYKVTAFFDGVEAVPTGTITVAAGDHKELRCSSQLMVCR